MTPPSGSIFREQQGLSIQVTPGHRRDARRDIAIPLARLERAFDPLSVEIVRMRRSRDRNLFRSRCSHDARLPSRTARSLPRDIRRQGAR